MNKKDRALVEKLISEYAEIEERVDELTKVFPLAFESPLIECMWSVFSGKVDIVSGIVGDNGEWISWYIYENKSGKAGLEAGTDENMRKIKDLDDLFWVINLEVD